MMTDVGNQPIGLFVDRHSGQWIARDGEGHFWALPPVQKAWDRRLPFEPKTESELEPIPAHYKNLLGLPR